jgi:ATP-dependent exoDNAse (exonuclease V) alpha subunit
MAQPAKSSTPTGVLAGLVDRVTFHNEENGFCVLRTKARGQRDLIAVLGHAAMISAGEFVQASGIWINDGTHGVQFKASFLKAMAPTAVEGIEKHLGSGMIRGIGPVYAKKLVRAFGEGVFEVIQQEPGRLREVTGIGPKRAARIIAGWAEQKVIREIMLFLHSNGVGTSRAVRIYKTFGLEPQDGAVIADDLDDRRCVFLAGLYRAEREIAEKLQVLAVGKPPWPSIVADKAIPWVEKRTALALAESQKEAVRVTLGSKVLVITGGPGVGKTTLVNSILKGPACVNRRHRAVCAYGPRCQTAVREHGAGSKDHPPPP